jgi:hypothetical protein
LGWNYGIQRRSRTPQECYILLHEEGCIPVGTVHTQSNAQKNAWMGLFKDEMPQKMLG